MIQTPPGPQQPPPNRNQKPQQQPQQQPPREKQIEEPGPPSRPALPQRLIVVPDPPQHANRPLPPTPRSSGSAQPQQSQSQSAQQQSQRNSQNMFKPMVSNYKMIYFSFFEYLQIVLIL